MESITKLKLGNEIEIKTIDGKSLNGIFVCLEKDYLSAIACFGIVYMIPLSSITDVIKI